MFSFTIYTRNTGEVLRWGTVARREWCDAQLQTPAEALLLREVPRGHYIVDSEPVPMPERPSADHVFDWTTHAWCDPRSIEDLRTGLKAEIARRRWACEVGGLGLPDGLRMGTGREDRAALAAAIVDMAQAGIEEIDFKMPGGFRRMTRDALQAVANVVTVHVQRCFSAEAAHAALIDSIADRSVLLHYPVADFPAVPDAIGQLA
ncbi:protein of unknown function [Variovorax sp. OK605]|uniref:DUF4376 domain-containing protein n=1 Tax=Variovorax sp. OK605 TaxID=1855317 RepID=UPI0008E0123A|nr:DUF4376 domain-containing protein [Variovorax sp. OK605]SFP43941.1 protein of unknown function [Variovorax sp. OK605]